MSFFFSAKGFCENRKFGERIDGVFKKIFQIFVREAAYKYRRCDLSWISSAGFFSRIILLITLRKRNLKFHRVYKILSAKRIMNLR